MEEVACHGRILDAYDHVHDTTTTTTSRIEWNDVKGTNALHWSLYMSFEAIEPCHNIKKEREKEVGVVEMEKIEEEIT